MGRKEGRGVIYGKEGTVRGTKNPHLTGDQLAIPREVEQRTKIPRICNILVQLSGFHAYDLFSCLANLIYLLIEFGVSIGLAWAEV
jgi:hypothetical protein